MGGSVKGDGLKGGTDQGRSTWEAVNGRVSETQSDHLPNSPPIPLDEDNGNVGDLQYIFLARATTPYF